MFLENYIVSESWANYNSSKHRMELLLMALGTAECHEYIIIVLWILKLWNVALIHGLKFCDFREPLYYSNHWDSILVSQWFGVLMIKIFWREVIVEGSW